MDGSSHLAAAAAGQAQGPAAYRLLQQPEGHQATRSHPPLLQDAGMVGLGCRQSVRQVSVEPGGLLGTQIVRAGRAANRLEGKGLSRCVPSPAAGSSIAGMLVSAGKSTAGTSVAGLLMSAGRSNTGSSSAGGVLLLSLLSWGASDDTVCCVSGMGDAASTACCSCCCSSQAGPLTQGLIGCNNQGVQGRKEARKEGRDSGHTSSDEGTVQG